MGRGKWGDSPPEKDKIGCLCMLFATCPAHNLCAGQVWFYFPTLMDALSE